MKNNTLTIFLFLAVFTSYAQKKITWDDLAKVKFDEKYLPDYEQSFLFPKFSPAVKELAGKKVTIKGYFLDIDPEGKIYVLSKGPMAACFFCGEGGPETAVELHFKNKPPFKMDEIVSVTGVLKINSDDINHFNYILTDCEGKLVAQ